MAREGEEVHAQLRYVHGHVGHRLAGVQDRQRAHRTGAGHQHVHRVDRAVATDLARTALEYGRDADGKQRALLIGQVAAASAANGEYEAARSGIREARK
ncbi:hypothetical protein [Streptomyces sp. NPDC049906]|uniref:hypothetical protein n=1 Tax=Streptomyces sp. NPDC049906 TaxID=3155656 RepID=UPI00343DB8C9